MDRSALTGAARYSHEHIDQADAVLENVDTPPRIESAAVHATLALVYAVQALTEAVEGLA